VRAECESARVCEASLLEERYGKQLTPVIPAAEILNGRARKARHYYRTLGWLCLRAMMFRCDASSLVATRASQEESDLICEAAGKPSSGVSKCAESSGIGDPMKRPGIFSIAEIRVSANRSIGRNLGKRFRRREGSGGIYRAAAASAIGSQSTQMDKNI